MGRRGAGWLCQLLMGSLITHGIGITYAARLSRPLYGLFCVWRLVDAEYLCDRVVLMERGYE